MEKKGKKKMFELYLNRMMRVSVFTSISLLTIAKLFSIRNLYFIKTGLYLFAIALFAMGLWAIFGTIYRWKSFKKAYRSINLESYFGGIGSNLYVILGIVCCLASILLFIMTALKNN
jgi:hypothetical protein